MTTRRTRGFGRARRRVVGLACVAGTLLLSLAPMAHAGGSGDPSASSGTAVDPGPAPGPGQRADSIPFWTGSFDAGGVTYPFDMVGTNPSLGGSTTVATELLPLRVVFSDGTVFDASSDARSAATSPLFNPASFVSGTTQFGDALQRGEFWGTEASGYHVLLGQPDIRSTVTLQVPASKGSVAHPGGIPLGVIDPGWFLDQLHSIINQAHVSPQTLPVVLSHSVHAGFSGVHGTMGGAGPNATTSGPVHGGGDQAVQTYVYATWFDARFQFPDAWVLSHEIAEWLNDPFANNVTANWISPLPMPAGFYGCSHLLEVGDPLVHQLVDVGGFHLQDEAFLSWFARQSPSIGINGQYSLFGTFTAPAPTC